jgi:hypothetical protein
LLAGQVARQPTVEEAYVYCRRVTLGRYENFKLRHGSFSWAPPTCMFLRLLPWSDDLGDEVMVTGGPWMTERSSATAANRLTSGSLH